MDAFTPPPPLVELRNVTFGYGDRAVLDGITLTIPRGKVTALMGASGGGKTTVLRLARTLAQAEAMVEAGVDLDAVVEIDVPDSVIVKRMSGRRVHLPSGRTYHITHNPPKAEGKDDISGEDLIQRDDDKEEVVQKRLAVYHEQTEVLVDFYSKLEGEHAPQYIKVDGTQPVDAVKTQVLGALGK